MRQTFTVEGNLAGQNEITNSNRTNYNAGAKLKKREQERVMWAIRRAPVSYTHLLSPCPTAQHLHLPLQP